jgi:uncharacterized protein (DUF1697 family)
MPVMVALLRGINLGTKRRVRMDDLRALYTSLDLEDVRTLVQSGNVVFRTMETDAVRLRKTLEDAFAKRFGFHSDVILRTNADLKKVMQANPFAGRKDVEPAKLLVTFLAGDPGEAARRKVREIKVEPEEVHLIGREMYIYFPNGMGRSTLPFAPIERALATTGTARNWNSVTKVRALAESLDAGVASA